MEDPVISAAKKVTSLASFKDLFDDKKGILGRDAAWFDPEVQLLDRAQDHLVPLGKSDGSQTQKEVVDRPLLPCQLNSHRLPTLTAGLGCSHIPC
jgi:hypothetical protein